MIIAFGMSLRLVKEEYMVKREICGVDTVEREISSLSNISLATFRQMQSANNIPSMATIIRLCESDIFSFDYSFLTAFSAGMSYIGKKVESISDFLCKKEKLEHKYAKYPILLESLKLFNFNEQRPFYEDTDWVDEVFTANDIPKGLLKFLEGNVETELNQNSLTQAPPTPPIPNTVSVINHAELLSDVQLEPLHRLQVEASSQFVIDYVSRLEQKEDAQDIPKKIKYSKIDMTHIQGKYIEAVSMIDKLLSHINEEDINRDDEICYLYMRQIHHQMMFTPVSELINSIQRVVDRREKEDSLHIELLFMLGGNLGALGGDFKKSRRILFQAISLAIKLNDVVMLCRIYRKYADFLKERNHFSFAHQAIEKATNIALKHGLERYLIYLMTARADILSSQGQFKEALDVFRMARSRAQIKNMEGWIGHTYLGEAKLHLSENNFDMCRKQLSTADSYYQVTNQAWGKIQVLILRSMLKKQQNDLSWSDELSTSSRLAEHFNYSYELRVSKCLLAGDVVKNYSLMFL